MKARFPICHSFPAEGTGHHNIGNYLNVKCNYLLEIDNLMDLSHVNFIHFGSLGNDSMRAPLR
jgi:vanillate O-demethylase monooxygenase subunit